MRRFLADAGTEACCVTGGQDNIAHRRRCPMSAIDNECFVGKSCEGKDSSRLVAGECMALRQSHDQRLVQQWMEDYSIQFGALYPHESGVQSISLYAFD